MKLGIFCSLSRNFGSALLASSFQDIPAIFGGHALKEAVLTGSLAFFGLIRSFRHGYYYTRLLLFAGYSMLITAKYRQVSEINNVYPANPSKFSTYSQVFSTVFKIW
jgi:hypothetical protein